MDRYTVLGVQASLGKMMMPRTTKLKDVHEHPDHKDKGYSWAPALQSSYAEYLTDYNSQEEVPFGIISLSQRRAGPQRSQYLLKIRVCTE